MTGKGIPQTNRENCYFCGSEGPIQTHHIIPRRHGGGDAIRNLVDLCPTCHQRLERLYDDRFYAALGVGPTDKQVSIIHEAIASEIEEVAEMVNLELVGLSDQIRSKYIRGEVSETALEIFRESDGATDTIETGASGQQRDRVKTVRETIKEHEEILDDYPSKESIISELVESGMERTLVEHEIEKLRQRGEVYEPVADHFATT